MKIGVIADDYTGASDIALVLSESGLATMQFNDIPKEHIDFRQIMAGVVALKSRNLPANEAIEVTLEAAHWLLNQGVDQIIFKVCSTFDSTESGNIGPVTEALANLLDVSHVIVCPAYPEAGRTVYQGHLFVHSALLHECGMQNHPLTPMTDSDIRRVMHAQSTWPVTHISLDKLRNENNALEDQINSLPASHVIIDAIADKDLSLIGLAAKNMRLLTGAAGIARGLHTHYPSSSQAFMPWQGSKDRAVVMCGSCSERSREQIQCYKKNWPSREIDVSLLLEGSFDIEELMSWVVKLPKDQPPLIYTSANPDVVTLVQEEYGVQRTANAVESLFGSLAVELHRAGCNRFVVAGGETSGAVTSALNVTGFEIGPKISTGVPAMKAADQGIYLALKSGNFGNEDFFEIALEVLSRKIVNYNG